MLSSSQGFNDPVKAPIHSGGVHAGKSHSSPVAMAASGFCSAVSHAKK